MFKSAFYKSYSPFFIFGVLYSLFFYWHFFDGYTNFLFYNIVIFIHYTVFIIIGSILKLFCNEKSIGLILQLLYAFIFLLLIITSIGSYISFQNWHSPINQILLFDFFSNHKFYISTFSNYNYYLIITIVFLILLIMFWSLGKISSAHQKVVSCFSQRVNKKSIALVLMISILFIVLLFFSSNVYQSFVQIKQKYIQHDPIFHLYYSSVRRQHIKTYIKQTEANLEEDLKKQFPKNRSIPTKKKNVILFTVDALRSDYLPCYGFEENLTPHLDSFLNLNNHAIVDYPLAVCNYSMGGISSILEGNLSDEVGIKKLGLQNYLSYWDYQNIFILGGNHTGFGYMDLMYGNTIDFYFEGNHTKKYAPTDDRFIIDQLSKYFNDSSIEKSTESNFFWFHLMSAHITSRKEKAFQKYHPSDLPVKFSKKTKYSIDTYINNYKNGILQTDDIINSILNILKDNKILENHVIVISADHGESLGEFGYFTHANTLNYPELNIPFIIIDSDFPLNSSRIPYGTQIDIAPTIVDRLGLPIPESYWDGSSIFKPRKNKIIPLSSSEKDEFGVATPYKDTWLALIKKDNKERFFILNKDMEDIDSSTLEDSLLLELRNGFKNNFPTKIID